jgi:hypothetical protein
MRESDLRAALRPHGQIARNCTKCVHFADCGGIEPELNLFNVDCIQANCCSPSSIRGDDGVIDCDNVCPNNPKYFKQLHEIGGLSFDKIPTIRQLPTSLPIYIPHIYLRYSKKMFINWPIVSLDTYQVVRVRNKKMKTIADTPARLRSAFGLAATTAIVLRGVADDVPLERYWSYRNRDRIPDQLQQLDVELAIGPNYSHFLDVPRHDNLFNRKRQLICLDEFQRANLNLSPHLNAVQQGDWVYWERFLCENPSVNTVAVEFQTGNRSLIEGQRVITRVANLQDRVGRRIHPVVIGGTQFLESFSKHFDTCTFIDSTPFMKTIHRKLMVAIKDSMKFKWRSSHTKPGDPLDEYIIHNITHYSEWIRNRWAWHKK